MNGRESNREPYSIVKEIGLGRVFVLDLMESRVILYLPASVRED